MKNTKSEKPIQAKPTTTVEAPAELAETDVPKMSAPIVAEVSAERDPLWELYLARVSHAETIATMRRDVRVVFEECFAEARAALEVYKNKTKKMEV